MIHGRPIVFLLVSVGLVASCSPKAEFKEGTDPSGMWVGDFGPAFYDRNTITLELNWDGRNLTGNIRPGVPGARMYRSFDSFPIENASYDSKTGVLKFEATYRPKGRHYVIEGKLRNNVLIGNWNRPDENKDGDFKLTRSQTTTKSS